MPKIAYERIGEYVRTALQIVSDNGGALRSREVFQQAGQRLVFDDYETERFEKTGYVRWTSFLSFYSIYAVKAGWIVKNAGIWHITPEGESALELSNINFRISKWNFSLCLPSSFIFPSINILSNPLVFIE